MNSNKYLTTEYKLVSLIWIKVIKYWTNIKYRILILGAEFSKSSELYRIYKTNHSS